MKWTNLKGRRTRSTGRKSSAYLSFDRCEDRTLLSLFTVTKTVDDGTAGTLRAVIADLNATGTATNTIRFQLGSGLQTMQITQATALDTIQKQVSIEGYTQDSSSQNTASIGTNAIIHAELDLNGHGGLTFGATATGSTVTGLSIYGGTTAITVGASSMVLAGNFIGIKADGTTVSTNATGILVQGGATGVTIGGAVETPDLSITPLGGRNLISGNTTGVSVADNTLVVGNYFGTDSTGLVNKANVTGIVASGSGASLGSASLGGNVFGFNSTAAISLTGNGNSVLNNLIGTDSNGASLGNGTGISITSSGNFVGGSNTNQANTIAFNANAVNVADSGKGNLISQNLIYANTNSAINLNTSGNDGLASPTGLIVTSVPGSAPANDLTSIQGKVNNPASSSSTYTIEFFRSVPGDNLSNGQIQARVFIGSTTVTVPANGSATFNKSFLGTLIPAGQVVTAIAIYTGSTNATLTQNDTSAFATPVALTNPFVVTTTEDDATNPIVGSLRAAILNANANPGTDSITFAIPQGDKNFANGVWTITPAAELPHILGTVFLDATSQSGYAGAPVIQIDVNGQSFDGLTLDTNSGGSTIKGFDIINAQAGIRVLTNSNVIQNNYLGIDLTDPPSAAGNVTGIFIAGANNMIGGLSTVGNVISGNTTGVSISGAAATGNSIQGNRIGTDLTGTLDYGNGDGIIIDGASNNSVGGTAANRGNIIAFNTGSAVTVTKVSTNGDGNLIRLNSIFRNKTSAIVLNGGANNNEQTPSLSNAQSVGNSTSVTVVTSGYAVGTIFDFYASAAGDPNTQVQARTYLGSSLPLTQQDIDAGSIIVTLSNVTVPIGQTITATATSSPAAIPPAANNTSQFANFVVVANPFLVTTTADNGSDAAPTPGSLRAAIINANNNPGLDTISFALTGSAPFTFNVSAGHALPTITSPVILDGTSQAGYSGTPVIIINGGGQSFDGLTLGTNSDGSIIRGLSITNFAGAGILIQTNNNTITNNAISLNGTAVIVNTGTGNSIRVNSIFQNDQAIVFQSGGNNGQVAPVIKSVNSAGSSTTVTVDASSLVVGTILDFYSSASGDPNTPGQAHVYLGSYTLQPGDISTSLIIPLSASVPAGQSVTATATSPASATPPAANNTSQFASSVLVANPFVVTTTDDNGSDAAPTPGSLRAAIINANNTVGTDTITFALTGSAPYTFTVSTNALPTITSPIVIDGTTLPGYIGGSPLIVIDGNSQISSGLILDSGASGSLIQGLRFTNFTGKDISVGANSIGNVIRQNLYDDTVDAIDLTAGSSNQGQDAPTGIAFTSVVNPTTPANNLTSIKFSISDTSVAGTYTVDFYGIIGSKLTYLGSRSYNQAQASGTKIETFTGFGLVTSVALTLTAPGSPVTIANSSAFSTAVSPTDAFTVSVNADSGFGSLRFVIGNINAAGNTNPSAAKEIKFTIGTSTIALASALPSITSRVTINGAAGITLTPTVQDAPFDGLTLGAGSDGSTIQGLIFTGFGGNNISIFSSNNLISGNTITVGPNSQSGVAVISGSGNKITANIYNGPLAPGVQDTQDIALSPGANNSVTPPAVTAVILSTTGTAPSQIKHMQLQVGAALNGQTIEAYFVDITGNQRRFLGSGTVVGGIADIIYTSDDPEIGSPIIATVTDTGNNTSAFSAATFITDANIVTNVEDDGIGSLRYVLANSFDGEEIRFHIGDFGSSQVIQLKSPLAPITHRLTINGWSQGGDDYFGSTILVQIDGSGINPLLGGDGFVLDTGSDRSVIKGLSIYGFQIGTGSQVTSAGAGIRIKSDNNTISGVILGANASFSLTNDGNTVGLFIDGGSNNVIGQSNTYDPVTSALTRFGTVTAVANDTYGIHIKGGGSNSLQNVIAGATLYNINGTNTNNGNHLDGLHIEASKDNKIGFAGTSAEDALNYFNIFSGNGENGIYITGNSPRNAIVNSYIGTDGNGALIGNEANGIFLENVTGISSLADGITIGGTAPGSLNLIQDNGSAGIRILRGSGFSQIVGNFISGNQDPNLGGIVLDNTSNHQIRGNTVSGNRGFGILIQGGSANNAILGNTVGQTQFEVNTSTDDAFPPITGTAWIINGQSQGNFLGGIRISDSFGNSIGGTADGDGNSIFGNILDGISIDFSVANTLKPNEIINNQISYNGGNGIFLEAKGPALVTGASNPATKILGNYIGTDKDGMATVEGLQTTSRTDESSISATISGTVLPIVSVGNGKNGILLEGLSAEISRNVISGNGISGISAVGSTSNRNLAGTLITSNMIGLNKAGDSTYFNYPQIVYSFSRVDQRFIYTTTRTVLDPPSNSVATSSFRMGNVLDGILLDGVSNVVVGGIGTGNAISGNLGRGVEIRGGGELGVNRIEGNFIGTSMGGSSETDPNAGGQTLGNLGDGVFLLDVHVSDVFNKNVISGNRGFGIHAKSSSNLNSFFGNFIGTGAGGNTARDANGTSFGNNADGIFFDDVHDSKIGGTGGGQLNVISNNSANGINLLHSSNVTIVGNYIGTNSTGSSLGFGNSGNGIVLNQSQTNTIGGSQGAGNFISGNSASGINILGTSSNDASGNTISWNTIGLGANGEVLPNAVSGVVISGASSNTVQQNTISGNRLYGVQLAAGATRNTIAGNFIGTDAAGRANIGNTSDGIFLINSPNNLIGGTQPGSGNIISGNFANGVRIFGAGSTDNSILGNLIGLRKDGFSRMPNLGNGILFDNAGAGNQVGNGTVGGRNIISGNIQSGVLIISSGPSIGGGIHVQGNYIGTNYNGTGAIGNGANGILVFGSSNNVIGGSPGFGNLISGNLQSGVFLYSAAAGALANNNLVVGNLIGTDASGQTAIPNNADGVQIVNGNSNTISFNVLSGNLASGVNITAISDSQLPESRLTASFNVIDGNKIGTRADGMGPLANSNQQSGVVLQDASDNMIGAVHSSNVAYTNVPSPELVSNIISTNRYAGILINGVSQRNRIQGNYIGIDAIGQNGIGNGIGVYLNNTTGQPGNNSIGGSEIGTGNIISGNAAAGVNLFGPDANASAGSLGTANVGGQNAIQGNLIGLGFAPGNPSQYHAVRNAQGVLIQGSSLNTVGGTTPSARNVISGNSDTGVLIQGTSLQNTVLGNYIGVDPYGNATIRDGNGIPIQAYGVQLSGNAFNNTVGTGGTFTDGSVNVVSGNQLGIAVNNVPAGATGMRNLIQGNIVGLTPDGMSAAPNSEYGIHVNNSPFTLVQGNLASANQIAGIGIFGSDATNVTVVANMVGTNIAGNPSFAGATGRANGGQLYGVVIIGASNNTIGTANAGNLISGNTSVGVYISRQDFYGNTYSVPTNNNVFGNTITRNRQYGILFYNAPNNQAPPFTGSGRRTAARRRRAGSNNNVVAGNGVSFLNFITRINGQNSLRRSPKVRAKAMAHHHQAPHLKHAAQPQAQPLRVIMPKHQ